MPEETMDWIAQDRVHIEVHAGGRKNRILCSKDGILHVEVKPPAEQGRANAAVERLLTRLSGREAKITKGFTQSLKTIRLG